MVTRDPDTGERNVGMYRIQVYDDQTTGMHWQLQKVGARHGRRYYETGTRMPVSIFIGGASVKLFLPIFKMNFPEIVDIALPAEGVFHNLVFVSIKKTYPMQAYKIMHGLWGMGQMMFTKYIVVVDDDVNVHNTSEVLFRLCANTDPQRDSIFTKGPADVLDHATSEIAMGTKLGIDATRKLAGEGFKRPWPPLIRMSEEVRRKIDTLFGK